MIALPSSSITIGPWPGMAGSLPAIGNRVLMSQIHNPETEAINLLLGCERIGGTGTQAFPRVAVSWRDTGAVQSFEVDAKIGTVLTIAGRETDILAAVDNPVGIVGADIAAYRFSVSMCGAQPTHEPPTWSTYLSVISGAISPRIPIPAMAHSVSFTGGFAQAAGEDLYLINGPSAGDIVDGAGLSIKNQDMTIPNGVSHFYFFNSTPADLEVTVVFKLSV